MKEEFRVIKEKLTGGFEVKFISKEGMLEYYTNVLFRFAIDYDDEIAEEAVMKKPNNIQYIRNQYQELCDIAIEHGASLEYIKDEFKTRDLCEFAIEKNGINIKFSPFKDDDLCLMAVENNPMSIRYIENQNPNLCLTAVSLDGSMYQYIKDEFITEEICELAVEHDQYMLMNVKYQTEDMCLKAVKKRPFLLRYVKNQTFKVCLASVSKQIEYHSCIRDNEMHDKVIMTLLALSNKIVNNK